MHKQFQIAITPINGEQRDSYGTTRIITMGSEAAAMPKEMLVHIVRTTLLNGIDHLKSELTMEAVEQLVYGCVERKADGQ